MLPVCEAGVNDDVMIHGVHPDVDKSLADTRFAVAATLFDAVPLQGS